MERKRLRSLEVTALFGGIGGLELGLERQGHRTTLFCECDPEATAVLAHRFPAVPIAFDVRNTAELLDEISPTSDLLTAGFPCTDLSQAGKTLGFEGGRSGLIRDVIRLLERREFPALLIENVPNWRMLHRGAYLAEVLDDLERLGYRWAYRTVNAQAFGLPQRRHRIFLYAVRDGDPRDVLFHGDELAVERRLSLDEAAHGFYWTEGSRGLGWGEDCVPTLKGGSTIGIPAAPAVLMPEGAIVTPDLRDGERLQGFPAGWTDMEAVLPQFGGGRFRQRKRWLLIGNAVNVAVSSWLGRRLAEPNSTRVDAGPEIEQGTPWPAAAWFDGRTRRKAEVGAWPVHMDAVPLARFLTHPGTMLSHRATAGFLSRISKSSLRFRPGFKEAVARHLRHMELHDGRAPLRKVA